MSEFLLELYSEEIPALMQSNAANGFKKIFVDFLKQHQIKFDNIEIYYASRRICLRINELAKSPSLQEISIKGPKISAPAQAIDGFCRSNNISKDQLIEREIKGEKYFFYINQIVDIKTRELLKDHLPTLLLQYAWPKSMYWGNSNFKWVRPLRSILCIFDGAIIDFNLDFLTASNISFGHSLINNEAFIVENFSQYQNELKKRFVLLNQEDRKSAIKAGIDYQLQQLNAELDRKIQLISDDYLLEEVNGLIEYPLILSGVIPGKFLSMPGAILRSSMRAHQKYFACSYADTEDELAPYFIFVSNCKSDESGEITQGNERVLTARLTDALHFYDQDLETSLDEFRGKLKSVVFHKKIGSLFEKTQRLEKIIDLFDSTDQEAKQAAIYSKCDITSQVVGEFPNLQGFMGSIYANGANLSSRVQKLIECQYMPTGAGGAVPTSINWQLALSDKLDNLVGLMLAGEKPTGSKDPYALRRCALGIIAIIEKNNLDIKIAHLIEKVSQLHGNAEMEISEINQFIAERLFHYLKSDFPEAIVKSCIFAEDDELHVLNIIRKVQVISKFLGNENHQLISAYKRICNIGLDQNNAEVDSSIIDNNFEKRLYQASLQLKKDIENYANEGKYNEALQACTAIIEPLNDFFDNIMVKSDNNKILANRSALLNSIKKSFSKITNFDLL